eukprot:Clim_evm2s157 gene=Clim_evmTU2s157
MQRDFEMEDADRLLPAKGSQEAYHYMRIRRLIGRQTVILASILCMTILTTVIGSFGLARTTQQCGSVDSKIVHNEDLDARPKWEEHTRRARWMIDHGTFGIISLTQAPTETATEPLAFGTVEALANVDGQPFFYISGMSTTFVNLQAAGPRGTVTLSEEMMLGGVCSRLDLDVEDPRCGRLWLVGYFRETKEEETEAARNALFKAHPPMAEWPTGHEWHVMTMDIERIAIIDYFGGMVDIPLDEYFH